MSSKFNTRSQRYKTADRIERAYLHVSDTRRRTADVAVALDLLMEAERYVRSGFLRFEYDIDRMLAIELEYEARVSQLESGR